MSSSPSARRLRKDSRVVGIAAALCAAATALAPADVTASPRPVGAFSFAVTAFVGFQPDPCDCPIEPLGGWAERAAVFDSLAAAGSVAARFEAGGWLGDGVSAEVAALTADALAALAYDGVNVGSDELPFVEAAPAAFAALPLVCGHPERPPGVPSWRTLITPAGTIGLIGAAWFGPDVARPDEQVRRALAEMPDVDEVVVLCGGDLGPAGLAGRADPRVDLVLYGGGARTPSPVEMGHAFGVAPGAKGRYVGWVTISPDREPPPWTLIPVRPRADVDPHLAALALRAAFRQEGPVLLRERFTYLDSSSR